MTSRLAERTGLLATTELLLEQADVPLRAAELLFYTPAFAIIVFLLLAVIAGPLAGLIGGVVVLRRAVRLPQLPRSGRASCASNGSSPTR